MFKLKTLIYGLFIIFSSTYFSGCCGLCNAFIEGFKEGSKPRVPVKMSLDDVNEKGVEAGAYIQISGMPSYYDMVYTYSYDKNKDPNDPNNIKSIDSIYYPIMSKKQYELYLKSLVKNDGGGYNIDPDKANSIGLKFRVFVSHYEKTKSFIDEPGKEQMTVYTGAAYTGKEIDEKALNVIKSSEIGPLLHDDLILIYMVDPNTVPADPNESGNSSGKEP
ncbi:MAG: hypothetical protein ABRQ38_04055, partial [Candidatus Eremiobacterota bacterium]